MREETLPHGGVRGDSLTKGRGRPSEECKSVRWVVTAQLGRHANAVGNGAFDRPRRAVALSLAAVQGRPKGARAVRLEERARYSLYTQLAAPELGFTDTRRLGSGMEHVGFVRHIVDCTYPGNLVEEAGRCMVGEWVDVGSKAGGRMGTQSKMHMESETAATCDEDVQRVDKRSYRREKEAIAGGRRGWCEDRSSVHGPQSITCKNEVPGSEGEQGWLCHRVPERSLWGPARRAVPRGSTCSTCSTLLDIETTLGGSDRDGW